ncbi:MAG: hypothetical protein ABIR47_10880 [Candidatus Kapaibacterium sp.]
MRASFDKYDPTWVATELGISEKKARFLMANGIIRSTNIGGTIGRRFWRTLPEFVEQYKRTYGALRNGAKRLRASCKTKHKPSPPRREPVIPAQSQPLPSEPAARGVIERPASFQKRRRNHNP